MRKTKSLFYMAIDVHTIFARGANETTLGKDLAANLNHTISQLGAYAESSIISVYPLGPIKEVPVPDDMPPLEEGQLPREPQISQTYQVVFSTGNK